VTKQVSLNVSASDFYFRSAQFESQVGHYPDLSFLCSSVPAGKWQGHSNFLPYLSNSSFSYIVQDADSIVKEIV
jgi:hypothetical protein